MPVNELNIFTYDDYRIAILDYYQLQKERHPGKFSYRYFARLAGFNTSNFIQLVIKGNRNLGFESVKKIARVMGLRGRAYDYFENLVFFNQAKTNDDKTRFYDRLVSFKEYQDTRIVSDSQKLYFSKWYYSVVREMVRLPMFKPDPKWISANMDPAIKIEQAKEALEILKKLKLIAIKGKRWVQKDAQLTSREQGACNEVVAYHRRMIHWGYDSLKKPADKRDISGITMAISPAKFNLIQKRIAAFREDIQSIIQN